ncbi:MAG: bactofilin family protein [Bacteriovoracaceae bacterium]
MESYLNNQNFSFLGKGSTLMGKLKLTGPTHLYSSIEGEILMNDDAKLIIERYGKVKGKINCLNLDIHGEFEGVIEAKGIVTVYPSAEVSGQVVAKELKIHSGANINFEGHTL